MKIIPVLGTPTHFGVNKVIRDHLVYSLVFQIGQQTALPMERAR